MQINLVYDRSVNNAPPEFITALNAAAEYLDGLILNPITVNVEVGYGEDAGQPLNADELGEGGPRFTTLAYSQITPDLTVGNLPAGDPTLGAGVDVSFAEEQAWGIAPAHTGQIDGSVGFSSAGPFDYSTTGAVPAHEYDFMGIAEHELTHALGRYSLLYSNLGNPKHGVPNDGIGSISICIARRAAVFCGTTNLFLNQRWRNQPGQLRYHFRRGRLGAREPT